MMQGGVGVRFCEGEELSAGWTEETYIVTESGGDINK